jgi:hypothetical protein
MKEKVIDQLVDTRTKPRVFLGIRTIQVTMMGGQAKWCCEHQIFSKRVLVVENSLYKCVHRTVWSWVQGEHLDNHQMMT